MRYVDFLMIIFVCVLWSGLWPVSNYPPPPTPQVLSGGRVLSLNSALVSDTGRYTCVAVNAGGEQHREYDLRVYGE